MSVMVQGKHKIKKLQRLSQETTAKEVAQKERKATDARLASWARAFNVLAEPATIWEQGDLNWFAQSMAHAVVIAASEIKKLRLATNIRCLRKDNLARLNLPSSTKDVFFELSSAEDEELLLSLLDLAISGSKVVDLSDAILSDVFQKSPTYAVASVRAKAWSFDPQRSWTVFYQKCKRQAKEIIHLRNADQLATASTHLYASYRELMGLSIQPPSAGLAYRHSILGQIVSHLFQSKIPRNQKSGLASWLFAETPSINPPEFLAVDDLLEKYASSMHAEDRRRTMSSNAQNQQRGEPVESNEDEERIRVLTNYGTTLESKEQLMEEYTQLKNQPKFKSVRSRIKEIGDHCFVKFEIYTHSSTLVQKKRAIHLAQTSIRQKCVQLKSESKMK